MDVLRVVVKKSACSLAALIVVAAVAGGARAQGLDPQVQRVESDWEARQNWFTNARFVVKGQRVIPKGGMPPLLRKGGQEVAKEVPPAEVRCSLDIDLLLDLQANRHRWFVEREQYNNLEQKKTRERFLAIFDGKKLTIHNTSPGRDPMKP